MKQAPVVDSPDRLRCCVPFCRRTRRKDNFRDWICREHWVTVPRTYRRRWQRLERTYKRRFARHGWWVFPAGSPRRLEAVKLDKLCRKAWERCRHAAIETAMGV